MWPLVVLSVPPLRPTQELEEALRHLQYQPGLTNIADADVAYLGLGAQWAVLSRAKNDANLSSQSKQWF